jgi:1-acyl-sn-glycerol-3-phosphate acyltransferase
MSAPRTHALRLPDLLIRNRNFVLLWVAYGVSAIGDHLSEMALLKERGGFDRNDITRVQALLTFGFFLPYVLIGPFAGWWADRFSRKWTMIGADVLRAGVMLSIVVVVPILARAGFGDLSVVLPLLLTGAFAAFFSPARKALLPTLVRSDQLVRANAMISAMGTIGAIFSGWLGGKLVDLAAAGHFGLVWNYRLDATTFGISGVLVAFLSMRLARVVPHRPLTGVWTPIVEGFRYVRQHRRVFQVILIGTVFWAGGGIVISVVPAIVKEVFGGTFSDAGMYRGLIAAGLALGAALLTVFGRGLPLPLAVLVGLFGGGFWVLALDAALIFRFGRIFSALCLVLIGAHGAALLISVTVAIQRFVPDNRRGRIFGVYDMATTGAMVLATGLLGLPHIPNLDLYIPYLLAATAVGLLAVGWLAWRQYVRQTVVPSKLLPFWYLLLFFTKFWCRARREGITTVPRTGPVILASNHTTGIDPIVIQGTTPHRLVSFLVAREYYKQPVAGWFMRQVDCVPIDRASPGKSFLSGSLNLLKRGGCLGIFPQGTYVGPDEEQPEAKYGIGLLALRTDASVIPCHISGTRYRSNPFAAFFVRHAVRIKYGRPIDLTEYRAQARDRAAAREVTELIMARINELAPPEGGERPPGRPDGRSGPG